MRRGILGVLVLIAPFTAGAQLVAPNSIPDGVVPVVFLDGYQLGCIGSSSFQSNFGNADMVLQASGLVTVYFDNCSVPGGPSIETLGAAFGKFLASLTYLNGTPVPLVDVVAHSMGGLIVRAYLSGMQPLPAGSAATFIPPQTPGIRKAIFLATPHFGTYVASDLGDDTQTHEMSLGSQFLLALNTWNQGTDDLRGVNALAIAGNGGTGLESALAGTLLSDFDDGVGTSFLTGTNAWQTLGEAIENDPNFDYGGILIGGANPNGATEAITSATDLGLNGGVAFSEAIPVKEFFEPVLTVNVTGSGTLMVAAQQAPGSTKATIAKTGPTITGVVPAGIAQFPRDVAPGAFVTVYGSNLTSAMMQAPQPYPTQLGDVQITVNETAAQIDTSVRRRSISFIRPRWRRTPVRCSRASPCRNRSASRR